MGMEKINRVSWATAPNLCQVKHFLPEDCPSKVGGRSPHHLQLKSSYLNITRPSFEGRPCLKQSKESLPYIFQVKWKCPSKVTLNDKWCVVAGEESKEAEVQKHREKRVLEAVYPSWSAIPPNPSTLLDLDQFYDDDKTQVIPIIPIEEEEEAVEVSSHLTPSNELQEPCLANNSSSSIGIETSQTLPANGKSFSPSLSTSQNLSIRQSNCPFSLTQPVNGQSAPTYPSRCQNLNGSEQHQVCPKPAINQNLVPQCLSTCQNLSIPLHQTELAECSKTSHMPKHHSSCENLSVPQIKSQVSGVPPANRKPAPQCPYTCENLNIPQQQTEALPKPLTSCNPATCCQSTYENLNLPQCKTPASPKPPANGISVPQYQSTSKNPSVQHKTRVCSNAPANEKSILEIPHGFEGDLVAATATVVTALAKSHEPGSLIDTDFLIKLLSNPEQIQTLMNEHGLGTNPKTGTACDSKPIVPSSTTPRTADSLVRQIAGNENHRCAFADSTVFSRSLEVRNTNEQRETAAISRQVDPLVPLPMTKPDKLINKPINEHQAPHAGSGPISGPKPMAKSVPLAIAKPENSVKSNLVNEQWGSAHVGIADIRGIKPSVSHIADLNLDKVKKLINEYGASDSVGGKPLVNSELVPSSFSKCDMVVSSRANLPITLQPELQIRSCSPSAAHTSPFSSMTSTPAPAHKDINYYKSLIKQHGENRESVDIELLQNTNRFGNMQGRESLENLKPNQSSLNFRKHCVFFNTSKGCLNGSSCPFFHDMTKQRRSGGVLEVPGSKRMKLTGRT